MNTFMSRLRGKLLGLGGGMLLLMAAGVGHAGTVTYVYTDPQGTPLAEANATGAITATFDYAPYGSQALGAAPNGPGYTGHVNDPDTGLVYMQARYYDPSVGRFLSADPVAPIPGNEFNFSRYAYANNNPIVNMDPDGRCSSTDPFPCEEFVSGDNGGGGGSSSAKTPASQAAPNVTSVFKGSQIDSAGNMTDAPIPPAMLKALMRILDSTTGQKIAQEATSEGDKINVALIPASVSLRYQWDPNAFAILYTLNFSGFVAANNKSGELTGIGLDTAIMHELGHTPYAAKAFGYPYQAGYWQNEFNAVNYVENPYRQFIGAPIRTTYSGIPIPPPSK